MVAVISVDAYHFLAFSELTCRLEDTRIGVFWLHCAELGSSDQEDSPSVGKNTRVVLVPCSGMEVRPTAISGGMDISEIHGCYLLRQMSSQ